MISLGNYQFECPPDASSSSGGSVKQVRVGDEFQVDIPDCVAGSVKQVRVGGGFQVDIPDCVADVKYQDSPEALLVWQPSLHLSDAQVDEYIKVAKDRHGYNMEQALSMLSWHQHDIDAALADIPKFTPFPDKWSLEDKVTFSDHRRSFHRIKQMHLLPFERAAVSLPGPEKPSDFVMQLLEMVASPGSPDRGEPGNHESHHDNHEGHKGHHGNHVGHKGHHENHESHKGHHEGHHDNHESHKGHHDNHEVHTGHDSATSSFDHEDSTSPLQNDNQVAQSSSISPDHDQISSLNIKAPHRNDNVYSSDQTISNHNHKANSSNNTESGQIVYQTETANSFDTIQSACMWNKRQKSYVLNAKSRGRFLKSKGKFFSSRSKCTFFKSRLKCKIFK